ncbi:MAG: MoaD/ThiS family protein [Pseudomonadota bacterium]
MKILIKLGGRIKEYQPDAIGGMLEITTSPDITLPELFKRLRITEDTDELLVVVDGENVPPSARAGYNLQEDQLINIMPPLKGG